VGEGLHTFSSVRATSPIRQQLLLHATALLAFPVFLVFTVYLTIGGPSSNLGVKLLVAVLLFAIFDLLLLETFSPPRRVDLDDQGVTFRFRLHRERRSWDELAPTIKPGRGRYRNGLWTLTYPAKSGLDEGQRRVSRIIGATLTREQARAILHYPSGKPWMMSPEDTRQLETS
jgi:hypothetical protein